MGQLVGKDHRRDQPARIDGPPGPRTQRRLEGFRDIAREAGLIDPRRIITTPRASTVTLGCELTADLLARAPDTDAILCNNDDLAMGALFECQRRGIDVPRQIGICGFNDLEMMAVANPAVTSVKTYRLDMGQRAMEMMIAALSGEDPRETWVDLGFEVVARDSTRGPAPVSRIV